MSNLESHDPLQSLLAFVAEGIRQLKEAGAERLSADTGGVVVIVAEGQLREVLVAAMKAYDDETERLEALETADQE